jgi:hypothetical protein
VWYINKRFKEFYELDDVLRTLRPDLLAALPKPKKFNQLMTSHSDPAFCTQRGHYLGTYLQFILDAFGEDIKNFRVLLIFLEIGSVSHNACLRCLRSIDWPFMLVFLYSRRHLRLSLDVKAKKAT